VRARSAAILAALLFAVGLMAGSTIFAKTVTVTETLINTSTITVTRTATATVTPGAETRTITATETIAPSRIRGVCFSAIGNCEAILIDLIGRANKSVHVMIYSFTLDELSEALIEAKNKGIDVKVVMEANNAFSKGSEYRKLLEAGVRVKLDRNPALMHHKVMIVDGEIVVTGSYNWSWSAENKNDENLVILDDPETASLYEEEFQRVWSQAA